MQPDLPMRNKGVRDRQVYSGIDTQRQAAICGCHCEHRAAISVDVLADLTVGSGIAGVLSVSLGNVSDVLCIGAGLVVTNPVIVSVQPVFTVGMRIKCRQHRRISVHAARQDGDGDEDRADEMTRIAEHSMSRPNDWSKVKAKHSWAAFGFGQKADFAMHS